MLNIWAVGSIMKFLKAPCATASALLSLPLRLSQSLSLVKTMPAFWPAPTKLNPATVKTRLFRARRLLRDSLERKFVTGLSGVFPFLGARCTAISDRVLERMK